MKNNDLPIFWKVVDRVFLQDSYRIAVTVGCLTRSKHLILFIFSFFWIHCLLLLPFVLKNRKRFRPLCLSWNALRSDRIWFQMVSIGGRPRLNFCSLHLHNMCFHLGLPCQYVSSTQAVLLPEQWQAQSVKSWMRVFACVCLLSSSGFDLWGEILVLGSGIAQRSLVSLFCLNESNERIEEKLSKMSQKKASVVPNKKRRKPVDVSTVHWNDFICSGTVTDNQLLSIFTGAMKSSSVAWLIPVSLQRIGLLKGSCSLTHMQTIGTACWCSTSPCLVFTTMKVEGKNTQTTEETQNNRDKNKL